MYRLLFTIGNNLSVESLINYGLDYSQIANLLTELFNLSLIENDNEKGIILTREGKKELSNIAKCLFSSPQAQWILPDETYRIEKKDKFAVYLPRKKG